MAHRYAYDDTADALFRPAHGATFLEDRVSVSAGRP